METASEENMCLLFVRNHHIKPGFKKVKMKIESTLRNIGKGPKEAFQDKLWQQMNIIEIVEN